MNLEKVRLSFRLIPLVSGVYFFKDRRGRILYIGKAVSLCNRLKSYFLYRGDDPRITKMLESADKVTWQETGSEIEALILESQLIKKYHPPFNVMLRDDKQYFYVGFTKEQFPKIFITHQPSKIRNSNIEIRKKTKIQNSKFKTVSYFGFRISDFHSAPAEWLGPFTDGGALKTTLRLLRRIFPYCTCKQKHNNYCLNYHIGKCLGVCCLKENQISNIKYQNDVLKIKNEYKKNIKSIKEILSGRRVGLIKKLEKEMAALAKSERFEEAAGLRDKIEKLKKVFENARILSHETWSMKHGTETQNSSYAALKKLAELLNLSTVPNRIEGYDVANIQGQFAVGAMVVFTNGQPDKKQYRKFRIRNINQILRHRKSQDRLAMSSDQGPNDVAMLREMLTRRFNHPEWPWPDLIVVDGGKAQLNAINHTAHNMKHEAFGHRKSKGLAMSPDGIPVIALTKNKKHRGVKIYLENPVKSRGADALRDHRASKKAAVPLSKLPPEVRNLILQVDAEAHRFAISYYRKLHGQWN